MPTTQFEHHVFGENPPEFQSLRRPLLVGEEEDPEALHQDEIHEEAGRPRERSRLAHPRLRGRVERLLLEPELRF